MRTKILNYRIIVEPDIRTGTNERCFTSYCPTLGIADSGDTIEEATANIKKGIQVWIKSLVADGEPVPTDTVEGSILTFAAVKAPSNLRVASI